MPRETMTARERWLAVLNREEPDRVPMDYWATPEATQKLMAYLGRASMDELYEQLHIDPIVRVGSRYGGPPVANDEDVFGCRHQNIDYGTGVYPECVYHPLARYDSAEEIEGN